MKPTSMKMGVEPEAVRIGMRIRARFRRNSKFDVTDVYFIAEQARRDKPKTRIEKSPDKGVLDAHS
jgi:hypothetical protein